MQCTQRDIAVLKRMLPFKFKRAILLQKILGYPARKAGVIAFTLQVGSRLWLCDLSLLPCKAVSGGP